MPDEFLVPYQPGPASLFAAAARKIATIEFSSKKECYLDSWRVHEGDILTARNLGNGLWAISFPRMELREFVHVNANDLNKLTGCELVEA